MNTAIIILSVLLALTVVLLVAFAMGCYRLDHQKDAEIKQLKSERLDLSRTLYWHRECKANQARLCCSPAPDDQRTRWWYDCYNGQRTVPGHSPADVKNFR